ncbi:MAG: dockerin type I repeat-containing protein [Planctomycetota bacterium]|nr:dockerin type I repeat-containing protein [Planctomycetota bacterium]
MKLSTPAALSKHLIPVTLPILFMTAPATAQDFSIPRHTIDGGGGEASGGPFSLAGTIGQHDAGGPMAGGNFSLSGGFWPRRQGEPCIGDFNNDGSVNTIDVVVFLNAWAGGDPSADINGDGTINTIDVVAFLNAWVEGC